MAQRLKRLPARRETRVQSLGREDPREKEMATHSSSLAWKIPWTEEPGGLPSMGSQRVGHDWVTSLSLFTFMLWRTKWQPTPVFLPGESQGWGSLVGCRLWGRTESDTTERLHSPMAALGLPWSLSGQESACQCRRPGFDPRIGKISWRRKWQPTPVFLPGKSHGQRSLAGYDPWGHRRVRLDWVTKTTANNGNFNDTQYNWTVIKKLYSLQGIKYLLSDFLQGSLSTLDLVYPRF